MRHDSHVLDLTLKFAMVGITDTTPSYRFVEALDERTDQTQLGVLQRQEVNFTLV